MLSLSISTACLVRMRPDLECIAIFHGVFSLDADKRVGVTDVDRCQTECCRHHFKSTIILDEGNRS
jgi:hypothetical protein